MKLINQNAELIKQPSYDLDGCFKMIEQAARVCYASESTSITSEQFVKNLIKSKHFTPLEFGTIHLKFSLMTSEDDEILEFYYKNLYSRVEYDEDENIVYITTNYRVIIEEQREDDLQFICNDSSEYFHDRLTFKFTTSEGIARELNRYRTHSICQQSTRYCNFSKDKFGNEITFIKPYWLSSTEYTELSEDERIFWRNCEHVEYDYIRLLNKGYKPQEVRDVLPLSTKTILMHCAYKDDWNHFLQQRYYETTGKAHPDCKELATKVNELL